MHLLVRCVFPPYAAGMRFVLLTAVSNSERTTANAFAWLRRQSSLAPGFQEYFALVFVVSPYHASFLVLALSGILRPKSGLDTCGQGGKPVQIKAMKTNIPLAGGQLVVDPDWVRCAPVK